MNNRLDVLELFSGSQTLRKAFEASGHTVTSLDIKKLRGTNIDTIITDIMDWNYRDYLESQFDVIWIGLPCTTYSKASGHKHFYDYQKPRTSEAIKSLEIFTKIVAILEYFNPLIWYIENPAGGFLNFPHIKDFIRNTNCNIESFYQSSYGYPIPKHTVLLTNNNIPLITNPYYRKKGKDNKQTLTNMSSRQRQSYPVLFCEAIVKNCELRYSSLVF